MTAPEHRCSACGTEETPQWRTGPTGEKTLCNACGIRMKRKGGLAMNKTAAKKKKAASPGYQHTKQQAKTLRHKAKQQCSDFDSDASDEDQGPGEESGDSTDKGRSYLTGFDSRRPQRKAARACADNTAKLVQAGMLTHDFASAAEAQQSLRAGSSDSMEEASVVFNIGDEEGGGHQAAPAARRSVSSKKQRAPGREGEPVQQQQQQQQQYLLLQEEQAQLPCLFHLHLPQFQEHLQGNAQAALTSIVNPLSQAQQQVSGQSQEDLQQMYQQLLTQFTELQQQQQQQQQQRMQDTEQQEAAACQGSSESFASAADSAVGDAATAAGGNENPAPAAAAPTADRKCEVATSAEANACDTPRAAESLIPGTMPTPPPPCPPPTWVAGKRHSWGLQFVRQTPVQQDSQPRSQLDSMRCKAEQAAVTATAADMAVLEARKALIELQHAACAARREEILAVARYNQLLQVDHSFQGVGTWSATDVGGQGEGDAGGQGEGEQVLLHMPSLHRGMSGDDLESWGNHLKETLGCV